MNPSGINSFDEDFMKATFTLTNAVPQFEASNSGPWQEFETKIRDYAKNICGPNDGRSEKWNHTRSSKPSQSC